MNADVVRYEARDEVARVTMNRPEYRNAQNGDITYGLDAAFNTAVDDDSVKVIVLAGAGEHFSAGHDIASPGRDAHVAHPRKASMWWNHTTHMGADARFAREQEVYLGMCRRWREIPKPVIAMVQGACIAGGLMLAWVCDMIVAADDAFFADPVVRMGIPGAEYFAHPWVMGPRYAHRPHAGVRSGAARRVTGCRPDQRHRTLTCTSRSTPRSTRSVTVDRATLLTAAQLVGLGRRCLDMSVAYARERH